MIAEVLGYHLGPPRRTAKGPLLAVGGAARRRRTVRSSTPAIPTTWRWFDDYLEGYCGCYPGSISDLNVLFLDQGWDSGASGGV